MSVCESRIEIVSKPKSWLRENGGGLELGEEMIDTRDVKVLGIFLRLP